LRIRSSQIRKKQPGGNLTVSVGIAEMPTHADDAGKLMDVVDEALYKVKSAGRNKVFVAEPYKGYIPSYKAVQVVTGPRPQRPITNRKEQRTCSTRNIHRDRS